MKRNYLYGLTLTIFLILGCSLSTASPNPATPLPIPTTITSMEIPYAEIIYYDVNGSSETDLREQLNTLSPTDYTGYRGDAVTSWDIRWTWDGYGTESCDLSSVTVTYDIRVQFPRWSPGKDVSHELIEKWNAYLRALAEHEKGHVDNVVATLPLVVQAIREGTCTTADARAQAVLTGIRQYDLDYDKNTGHGATQGAVFP